MPNATISPPLASIEVRVMDTGSCVPSFRWRTESSVTVSPTSRARFGRAPSQPPSGGAMRFPTGSSHVSSEEQPNKRMNSAFPRNTRSSRSSNAIASGE